MKFCRSLLHGKEDIFRYRSFNFAVKYDGIYATFRRLDLSQTYDHIYYTHIHHLVREFSPSALVTVG